MVFNLVLCDNYPSVMTTVWCKCLKGENVDEFDESKLHRQNFPYQSFNRII